MHSLCFSRTVPMLSLLMFVWNICFANYFSVCNSHLFLNFDFMRFFNSKNVIGRTKTLTKYLDSSAFDRTRLRVAWSLTFPARTFSSNALTWVQHHLEAKIRRVEGRRANSFIAISTFLNDSHHTIIPNSAAGNVGLISQSQSYVFKCVS